MQLESLRFSASRARSVVHKEAPISQIFLRGRAVALRLFEAARRAKRLGRSTLPKPAFASLLIFIVGGPVTFQSITGALQLSWSGYDPVRDAVSVLVFGPYGWLQTAAFLVLGCSVIALAVVLLFHMRFRFKLNIVALLLLGAAFIVVGANPTGLPGVEDTVAAVIHRGAAGVTVVAFPVACFLLVPALKARHHTLLRWITLGFGIFAVLFLSIVGVLLLAGLSVFGLYERVLLASGQLWVELICAQLIVDRLRERKRADVATISVSNP